MLEICHLYIMFMSRVQTGVEGSIIYTLNGHRLTYAAMDGIFLPGDFTRPPGDFNRGDFDRGDFDQGRL